MCAGEAGTILDGGAVRDHLAQPDQLSELSTRAADEQATCSQKSFNPSSLPEIAHPLAWDIGQSEPVMPPDDPERKRRLDWATLMQRAWQTDVLECPNCRGRMRLIELVQDPTVIEKILSHLGLPTKPPPRGPPLRRGWLSRQAAQLSFDGIDQVPSEP